MQDYQDVYLFQSLLLLSTSTACGAALWVYPQPHQAFCMQERIICLPSQTSYRRKLKI